MDTWRLDGTAPSDVHLIAAGSVEVHGGEVLVTADGRSIRVTTAEGVEPTTEVWELDDPELIEVWGAKLTRLAYRLEASSGSVTTIVEEVRP